MANNHQGQHHIIIDENEDGSRLDRVLLREFGQNRRSLIMRLIRKGNVRINGKRSKPQDRLHIEDTVFVPASLREVEGATPVATITKIRVPEILYQDNALMVLNKPAGMVVHGGSKHETGLIEQLKIHFQCDSLRLAHRLDRDTSGCLLLARQLPALRHLTEQFRERGAHKTYLAWVEGHPFPTAGRIESRLAKGRLQGGERMVVDHEEGKTAQTDFQTILQRNWDGWPVSLLALSPQSGRTHQLRVHMQQEGHAILGDQKYAEKESLALHRARGGRGLALHAWRLRFCHPYTSASIDVRAPWPVAWDYLQYNQ